MTASKETELSLPAPKLSFRKYAELLVNPFSAKGKIERCSMYFAAAASIGFGLKHQWVFAAGLAGLTIVESIACLKENTQNKTQKANLFIAHSVAVVAMESAGIAAIHYNIGGVSAAMGHPFSAVAEVGLGVAALVGSRITLIEMRAKKIVGSNLTNG